MPKFKLPAGPQAEQKVVDALLPGVASAKPRWREQAWSRSDPCNDCEG